MKAVLHQLTAATTARAGLKLGHLHAMHRIARGLGGLGLDQSTTEAD